jgi:hypothetical protein
MDGLTYVDECGRLYEVCFNCRNSFQVTVTDVADRWRRTKLVGVTGSKRPEVVEQRLAAYALKHDLVVYPDVICADCAQRAGKQMAEGHIATFYPAICDACGELVTCTEIRDYNHLKTVAELIAFHRIASGKGG